jgi:hypothetical protein
MGKVFTVSGIAAVAFTVIGWLAPVVFPDINPYIAFAFFVAALACLGSAFVWWILDTNPHGRAANSQSLKQFPPSDNPRISLDGVQEANLVGNEDDSEKHFLDARNVGKLNLSSNKWKAIDDGKR